MGCGQMIANHAQPCPAHDQNLPGSSPSYFLFGKGLGRAWLEAKVLVNSPESYVYTSISMSWTTERGLQVRCTLSNVNYDNDNCNCYYLAYLQAFGQPTWVAGCLRECLRQVCTNSYSQLSLNQPALECHVKIK